MDVDWHFFPYPIPCRFQTYQWKNCSGKLFSLDQVPVLIFSPCFQITGAGRGIGRELALQFSKLGCIIVCWDIDLEAAQETADVVEASGGQAHAFRGDVSQQRDVEATAQKVRGVVPHIDIIINNAGIMPCHPFLSHSIQEIDRCIDINVKGCIWVSLEQQRGELKVNSC